MKINIKATNIDLTKSINDYVNKKLDHLDKFISNEEDLFTYIEVGKTSNRHKQGEVYRAEFNVTIDGEKFFTESEKDNLFKAIDDAKSELIRTVKNSKRKKNTLYKRGASSIKKMLKGISKRNPFTSKY